MTAEPGRKVKLEGAPRTVRRAGSQGLQKMGLDLGVGVGVLWLAIDFPLLARSVSGVAGSFAISDLRPAAWEQGVVHCTAANCAPRETAVAFSCVLFSPITPRVAKLGGKLLDRVWRSGPGPRPPALPDYVLCQSNATLWSRRGTCGVA